MKRLLITSLALAALGSSAAIAADMPVKAPYLKAPPPGYSWTGCYLGGYVGGAAVTGGNATEPLSTGGAFPAGTPYNATNLVWPLAYTSSFIGGGTLGCNYQTGVVVFGLEGEYGYLHSTSSFGWPAPASDGTSLDTKYNSTIGNWYGVAAARLGLAATDRVMVYAKAGAAWTNVSSTIIDNCTTPVVCGGGTLNAAGGISNALGYAVGGGLEWAFMGNWSVKGEALYLGFNKAYSVCGPAGGSAVGSTFCATEKLTGVFTAKLGLNYKFDWSGSPVMAKY